MVIYSIQAMRGIAALSVVLYHYRAYLQDTVALHNLSNGLLRHGGSFGVQLFFIISGFIITYTTSRPSQRLPLPFLCKRMARVAPLAILTTIIAYVMNYPGHAASAWISDSFLWKSLLLMPTQNDNPPFFGYRVLSVQWTLTYELVFYTVFACALALNPKRRTVCVGCLILVMVFGLQCSFGGLSLDVYHSPLCPGSGLTCSLLSTLANPIYLEFMIGVFMAEIFIALPSNANLLTAMIAVASALGLFYSVFIWDSGAQVVDTGLICTTFFAALLFCEKLFPRIRYPRIIMVSGKLSYSIYLTHVLLDQALSKLAVTHDLSRMAGFPKLLILMVLTFSISQALYLFIEAPGVRMGRNLIVRLNNRPPGMRLTPQ